MNEQISHAHILYTIPIGVSIVVTLCRCYANTELTGLRVILILLNLYFTTYILFTKLEFQ